MASWDANLLGVPVVVREAGALHRNLDGCGRSEAHHLRDDVGGFKRHLAVGQVAVQIVSDLFAQSFAPRRIRLHGHLNDRFLGSAGEQMDQVDRITRRNDPHEVAGDDHVVFARILLNHAERAENNAFGLLDPRTGRRAQPDADQRSIGIRKQFGSHARHEQINERQ